VLPSSSLREWFLPPCGGLWPSSGCLVGSLPATRTPRASPASTEVSRTFFPCDGRCKDLVGVPSSLPPVSTARECRIASLKFAAACACRSASSLLRGQSCFVGLTSQDLSSTQGLRVDNTADKKRACAFRRLLEY